MQATRTLWCTEFAVSFKASLRLSKLSPPHVIALHWTTDVVVSDPLPMATSFGVTLMSAPVRPAFAEMQNNHHYQARLTTVYTITVTTGRTDGWMDGWMDEKGKEWKRKDRQG